MRPTATADDFARVAVLERRLDVARSATQDRRRSCAQRRRSAADAGEAAEVICDVAAGALDADLTRRCGDARRLAAGATAAGRRCAAEPHGD